MKWKSVTKPFKKLLTSNGGSTAGRNSAGRITSFHRGGGAKRLQRTVDLKRSTSSMGVVERIEYDPNRSSRVALVRWIEGVHPGSTRGCEKGFSHSRKATDPVTANAVGQFPLACLAPEHVVGKPLFKEGGKLSSVKDVFVSAFGSQRAKSESMVNLPRMAVAGAKPAVFAPQKKEQQVGEGEKGFGVADVQRWRKDSALWDHRLKKKAAMSWLSFVNDEPVGLAQALHNNKTESVGKSLKKRADMADRAPLTYILASNDMQPGKMVMNVDWSQRTTRS